jgi:hypothetical protein
MSPVKITFWVLLALCISMLGPETLVKMLAVYWLLIVAYVGATRVFFWFALRKGKVTVDFGCEHRAHSIHCDTLGSGVGECNCVPRHPTNCGYCSNRGEK